MTEKNIFRISYFNVRKTLVYVYTYLLMLLMPIINISNRINLAKFYLPKFFRSIPALFQTVNLSYKFVHLGYRPTFRGKYAYLSLSLLYTKWKGLDG